MEALEFDAVAEDDVIHIPKQYCNRIGKNFKVILLFDKGSKPTKKFIFSEPKLDTRGFRFSRKKANER